jgi:hypothetical protein
MDFTAVSARMTAVQGYFRRVANYERPRLLQAWLGQEGSNAPEDDRYAIRPARGE